jgi:hypothetical protein
VQTCAVPAQTCAVPAQTCAVPAQISAESWHTCSASLRRWPGRPQDACNMHAASRARCRACSRCMRPCRLARARLFYGGTHTIREPRTCSTMHACNARRKHAVPRPQPPPRLHRDWVHRCDVCTRIGLAASRSAPALDSLHAYILRWAALVVGIGAVAFSDDSSYDEPGPSSCGAARRMECECAGTFARAATMASCTAGAWRRSWRLRRPWRTRAWRMRVGAFTRCP